MNNSQAELLVRAILTKFELRGASFYAKTHPSLLTNEKASFVEKLSADIDAETVIASSSAAKQINDFFSTWPSDVTLHRLIAQGLVLERLGQAVYSVLMDAEKASPDLKSTAKEGYDVADITARAIAKYVNEHWNVLAQSHSAPSDRFAAFLTATRGILGGVDKFGTALESVFTNTLPLTFAEVSGRLTAELVPDCVEIGLDRRKVICTLTETFMGTLA